LYEVGKRRPTDSDEDDMEELSSEEEEEASSSESSSSSSPSESESFGNHSFSEEGDWQLTNLITDNEESSSESDG